MRKDKTEAPVAEVQQRWTGRGEPRFHINVSIDVRSVQRRGGGSRRAGERRDAEPEEEGTRVWNGIVHCPAEPRGKGGEISEERTERECPEYIGSREKECG